MTIDIDDINVGNLLYATYPFMDFSGRYCHVAYVEEVLCNTHSVVEFKICMLDSFMKHSSYQITEKSMRRAEPQILPNLILDKLFFSDI